MIVATKNKPSCQEIWCVFSPRWRRKSRHEQKDPKGTYKLKKKVGPYLREVVEVSSFNLGTYDPYHDDFYLPGADLLLGLAFPRSLPGLEPLHEGSMWCHHLCPGPKMGEDKWRQLAGLVNSEKKWLLPWKSCRSWKSTKKYTKDSLFSGIVLMFCLCSSVAIEI